MAIDEEIMEQIVHIPDEEEKVEELIEELKEEGFVITNFSKGGVFYILLRIIVQIGLELKQLAVDLINSAFMRHCPDDWVEIRAADYSAYLKEGVRTEGNITVYRSDASNAARVARGHPFRTAPDEYGNYLRYYALETTFIQEGQAVALVPVQAEEHGEAYNVEPGKIVHSMVHIDGLDRVSNEIGWITTEGTEEESLDSLRTRCINGRAENAERTIDSKIKSVAEKVKGVVVAHVNSRHPRGQGTVDVIVTGASGSASEQLLDEVREAISPLYGDYGDYLVKASTAYPITIRVKLYIKAGVSTDGYSDRAAALIRDMMDVTKRDELSRFYTNSIIAVLSGIENFRYCDILLPEEDIIVGEDVVVTLGSVQVTTYNVG